MKKIYYHTLAFLSLFFDFSVQAQKPNICITQPAGVILETTGLTLSAANNPTHGCKDFGQFITINALDVSSDPSLTFLFDAQQNATISDIKESSQSKSLDTHGEIWVISKRPNPSASGGHIIKCASIEIIETKRPNFEFAICGDLSSGGNAVVTLNTPTNSEVNIIHRIQSIPVFGNHPSNVLNSFTEEELAKNGNKRYVQLNITQSEPIIVPIISTFFSKKNPLFTCNGSWRDYIASPAQKPIRITELATSNDKKTVTLKLEHQKQKTPFKIDYRASNETSYQLYDEYSSPTVVFSIPGDPIPQTLNLDKVSLDVNKQYCFYAWEANACALGSVPSPPIKSNEVCSIHLKTNFLSGNKNQYRLRHEWNVSTTNTSKIISTEILNLNDKFGSPVFPSSTTFKESNFPANCADPNTSQISQKLFESTSVGETFDVTILSNAIPLDDIRIPVPTSPLLVSFAQNGAPEIDITILDIPVNNLYEIQYNTDESATYISLGESNSISQKHKDLTKPTAQYCYSYTKKVCNQISDPSDNFCTIKSELQTEGYLMNWTNFQPKPTSLPLFYDIEWTDAEKDATFSTPISFGSPTQDLEADLESILLNNPDVNTALVRVFTRQAPSLAGNSGISYSYPVTLVRPLALFFPNAFTPNNDGVNDIFKSASRIRQKAELLIFNRLGHLIFQTQDVNLGWDGLNLQGKKVDNGMYTYLIRVSNTNGTIQTQQGSFLVLY